MDGAELPRVSLILLTFNQQLYVAEAARSAFAQDYPNLELVFSDHGSSDGTLAILEELVAGYSGPHRVILNRSDAPGGVLGHVYDALARSSGGLIVGASGDDVSRPDRVSRLAARWRSTGAAILCSASETIDSDGRVLATRGRRDMVHDVARYFPDSHAFHVHGAAAAYDRRALEALAPPDFDVMSEDMFFGLMLGLRGARFEYLDEPLVRYRLHDKALSNPVAAAATLAAAEYAIERHSARAARLLRHAEDAATNGRHCDPGHGRPIRVDLRRLRADAAFHEARAGWSRLSPARRLGALRWARSPAQLRWMLPRLFGQRFLALQKQLTGRA
ncbi:glycosyltransferase [Sphingosinicella sp. YJ22]|uniref:glycosyltransferase n=1 Tax=Sphingosinicella sp. YJ22 TaxID=1104780 RepID=UPI00140AC426|nr:glycosyltransferase [Sphingosinicella sp. YJ22]